MLRNLGYDLGLETFNKFLRVSGLGFRFRKFWPQKKESVSEKIWYRKKVSVSVSEKFGLGKKYQFRKKYHTIYDFLVFLWIL